MFRLHPAPEGWFLPQQATGKSAYHKRKLDASRMPGFHLSLSGGLLCDVSKSRRVAELSFNKETLCSKRKSNQETIRMTVKLECCIHLLGSLILNSFFKIKIGVNPYDVLTLMRFNSAFISLAQRRGQGNCISCSPDYFSRSLERKNVYFVPERCRPTLRHCFIQQGLPWNTKNRYAPWNISVCTAYAEKPTSSGKRSAQIY